MIGNTYLPARVEPRVPDDRDPLRDYLRTEFGVAGGSVHEVLRVAREPHVGLNGGRNGWLAKARNAVAMAGVFLLSPSLRRTAGRTAPNTPSSPGR